MAAATEGASDAEAVAALPVKARVVSKTAVGTSVLGAAVAVWFSVLVVFAVELADVVDVLLLVVDGAEVGVGDDEADVTKTSPVAEPVAEPALVVDVVVVRLDVSAVDKVNVPSEVAVVLLVRVLLAVAVAWPVRTVDAGTVELDVDGTLAVGSVLLPVAVA